VSADAWVSRFRVLDRGDGQTRTVTPEQVRWENSQGVSVLVVGDSGDQTGVPNFGFDAEQCSLVPGWR